MILNGGQGIQLKIKMVFLFEFSNDGETGDRLFYGLKRNGRYYFDESPTKEIVLKGKDSIIARYESMNAFFSLKDDINKNNEYFISISTYSCFMEMYDITTDNFKNDTIYNANFVGNQIFSFKFELLEYSYSNTLTYYMIFCHSTNNEGQGDKLSIKKIQFSDLSFNSDDIVKTITVDGKLNDRTVTGFLVDDVDEDDYRILVAVYVLVDSTITDKTNKVRYKYNVYSLSDLSSKCTNKHLFGDELFTDGIGKDGKGHGLYFKILYLGNKDIAMTYFLSNWDSQNPRFQVLTINKRSNDNCYELNMKIYKEIEKSLVADLIFNDFIKITDTRLAFISTTGTSNICIILMDLYANNKNVQMRTYEYDISSYVMSKELAAHVYNGYLGFSSTVGTGDKSSIFMIFGFGNGTDFIIDISPHLMDTGDYTQGNDLVTMLLNHLTIDNNIFGYVPIEQIILVSYPEELLFYSSDNQITPLPNGTIIDNTHILM